MLAFFKRLQQILAEKKPGKKIHFIYTHKNGFDRFYHGIKANTEISYWCYSALKDAFPRVCFLKLEGEKEERIERIKPDDVVIGHVGETFLRAAARTRRLIMFGPWNGHEDHSKVSFNCVPKEIEQNFYNKAASLILLTSEFNRKKYLDKPTNFWYHYFQEIACQKRIHVVHQPIDLQFFKRTKWEYTTSNFVYIGNAGHMKGIEETKRLLQCVQKKLYIYGIEGNFYSHLDNHQVSLLPNQADFFIQHGMWEAQCVSILEQAARGFIPIVTPETGYPYDHPYLLRYGDSDYNLGVLKEILRLPPQEKRALADKLHQQLMHDENHNNWKKLTQVLVQEVKHLI